jgi:hypothetical protein
VYTYVVNEACSWPAEERLKKVRAIMTPIFELEDPKERDVIYARLYYTDLLATLTERANRVREGELDTEEARSAYAVRYRAQMAALRTEQLEHLTAVREALTELQPSLMRVGPVRGKNVNVEWLLETVNNRIAMSEQQREMERTVQQMTESGTSADGTPGRLPK